MGDLERLDLRSLVANNVAEVFQMMLSMDVELSHETSVPSYERGKVVASVSFAGKAMGILSLHVSQDFAQHMAAAMMGIDLEEVRDEEEIHDVLGEISNMIGGNLKRFFTDAGLLSELSPPAIRTGTDFRIESLNLGRYEHLVFRHQDHVIFLELGIQFARDEGASVLKETPETERDDAPGLREAPGKVDVEEIHTLDLKAEATGIVTEVFHTMLSMEMDLSEEVLASSFKEVRLAGSVSFAGDVMGIVNLYVEEGTARRLAAAMMGIEPEEVEGQEEIQDVLGELTNMIGGNLKTVFYNVGFFSELSPPSITTGRDFRIDALRMDRVERLGFRHGDHFIVVELGVEAGESRQNQVRGQDKTRNEPGGVVLTARTDVPQAAPAEIPEQQPDSGAGDEERPEQDESLKDGFKGSDESTFDGTSAPEERWEPSEKNIHQTSAADAIPVKAAEDSRDGGVPEKNIDFILDIPLEMSIELGRSKKAIQEVLKLGKGSIVELTKLEEDPVDIRVNESLVARGVVVVQREKYGIRITEIMSRSDRINSLK